MDAHYRIPTITSMPGFKVEVDTPPYYNFEL